MINKKCTMEFVKKRIVKCCWKTQFLFCLFAEVKLMCTRSKKTQHKPLNSMRFSVLFALFPAALFTSIIYEEQECRVFYQNKTVLSFYCHIRICGLYFLIVFCCVCMCEIKMTLIVKSFFHRTLIALCVLSFVCYFFFVKFHLLQFP